VDSERNRGERGQRSGLAAWMVGVGGMDGRGPPPLGGGWYVPGGGGGAIYGPGANAEVRYANTPVSRTLVRHLAHTWRGVHGWETRT